MPEADLLAVIEVRVAAGVEGQNPVLVPGLESLDTLTVDLGDDFPFYLMGIWDLIERDGTIVDNKSYKRTPTQQDLDKDLQFTAYAMGYRATHGEIEPGLRMDAVIKTKNPKAVQLYTKRTNDDCRWLLGLIEGVGKAIESGTFYPNPNGWHCSPKFCGFWDKCMGKQTSPSRKRGLTP